MALIIPIQAGTELIMTIMDAVTHINSEGNSKGDESKKEKEKRERKKSEVISSHSVNK